MMNAAKPRRYDIDKLRIFATYLLFVFHVAKVYDVAPFYQIKNAASWPLLDTFTGFIHQWHMPLFFLLAGWSACSSLQKRGLGGFLKERFFRIFLPFAIGTLIICPPMQYVHARTAMGFEGSFGDFLMLFFTRLEYFSWSHLWFLIYLFTFTLLYLPLFKQLVKVKADLSKLRPYAIYLPLSILILIQLSLRQIWPGWMNLLDDWANFGYYSLFFILGFLFSRFPTLEDLMQREWKRMLILWIMAELGMLVIHVILGLDMPELLYALFAVGSYTNVILLLCIGRHLLNHSKPVTPYLLESALPVYILHQPFIVIPGYFIVQLSLGIGLKFALHLIIAIAATMACYQLLVRPFKLPRLLFGMKINPSTSDSSPESAETNPHSH